jgi:hypothetical protein
LFAPARFLRAAADARNVSPPDPLVLLRGPVNELHIASKNEVLEGLQEEYKK